MKDETKTWLQYADENFESAKMLLDGGLFNPCLQNIQQAIEKLLKALLVEFSLKFMKTHSVNALITALNNSGIDIDISFEECDLLDSIYLPSKYPLGGVLPDFEPDLNVCEQCMAIVEKVRNSVASLLQL